MKTVLIFVSFLLVLSKATATNRNGEDAPPPTYESLYLSANGGGKPESDGLDGHSLNRRSKQSKERSSYRRRPSNGSVDDKEKISMTIHVIEQDLYKRRDSALWTRDNTERSARGAQLYRSCDQLMRHMEIDIEIMEELLEALHNPEKFPRDAQRALSHYEHLIRKNKKEIDFEMYEERLEGIQNLEEVSERARALSNYADRRRERERGALSNPADRRREKKRVWALSNYEDVLSRDLSNYEDLLSRSHKEEASERASRSARALSNPADRRREWGQNGGKLLQDL